MLDFHFWNINHSWMNNQSHQSSFMEKSRLLLKWKIQKTVYISLKNLHISITKFS